MNSTAYLTINLRSTATVRGVVSEPDPPMAHVAVEDGQLNVSFVATDPDVLLKLAWELRTAAGLLQAAQAGAA